MVHSYAYAPHIMLGSYTLYSCNQEIFPRDKITNRSPYTTDWAALKSNWLSCINLNIIQKQFILRFDRYSKIQLAIYSKCVITIYFLRSQVHQRCAGVNFTQWYHISVRLVGLSYTDLNTGLIKRLLQVISIPFYMFSQSCGVWNCWNK